MASSGSPRGRLGARRAGPFGQRLAVPVDRQLRRQDRPAHVGEAADEEAGRVADDVMVGLEEGDEAVVRPAARLRGNGRRRASCARRGGRPSPAARGGGAAGRRGLPSLCGSTAASTAWRRAKRSARGRNGRRRSWRGRRSCGERRSSRPAAARLGRKQVARTAIDAPDDRLRRNARFGEIAGAQSRQPSKSSSAGERDAVGVDHRVLRATFQRQTDDNESVPTAGFPNVQRL